MHFITSSFQLGKYKTVRFKFFGLGHLALIFFLIISQTTVYVKSNRPPRFLIDGQSEIVLRLKETPETPVDKLIYKLKGYDPDNDPTEFGVQRSTESDIIRIENIGKNEANIYLAKELDRELRDEYSIALTLTDGIFVVTQSFLLLVEDINDNEPIFKPYQSSIEIPEHSEPGLILTLEATDRDEGAYGQVVYNLQDLDETDEDAVFSVATHQGKGIIRLVGDLDYERKNVYQLRVLAVDRANQDPINTGTAAILVKVKDIEDQPPEFVQVQPVTRIVEGVKPGTEVLRVRAIDGDRGVNNKIRYSIEQNELFAINEDNGTIYTKKEIDREVTSGQINGAYILKVIAVEMTNVKPLPYAKTEVTIIVTDINDETPQFRESVYRCEIQENAQVNTPLNFLGQTRNEAFDYDLGNNGTFELFLQPDNGIFEISPMRAVNEANFLIRVKNPKALDFESVTEINMTIVAREITEPAKWSAAALQIFIRDQNDNIPEFTQPTYEINIPENSEANTSLVRIQATDADTGNYGSVGIRYTNITGGVAHLLFLHELSGIITIRPSRQPVFDRELVSRHFITVEARDALGKGNRNTVQVIINIDDVNDNPPRFLQNQYETKLFENKAEFENPLKVEARDADLKGSKNSEITYEIIDGHLHQNFTIDPRSGVIMPSLPVDFEELPAIGTGSVKIIELIIQARDSGMPMLSSKTKVVVYVQDVNDNIPVFQKQFYGKTIPEDLPGGSEVLQVKAFDRDGSAPNNVIVYRIKSGASDKFVINPDNGIIYVAKGASLDPDQTTPKTTYYSLVLIALDSGLGDNQLMAVTTVNITVKDVNNKPPIFQSMETLYLKENTAVGTDVYRLVATDTDETAVLRYHFDPKKSEARSEEGTFIKLTDYDFVSCFELNSLDGIIKVVKLLDREKVEQIKLGVVVQDLATKRGSRTATSALTIIVEDENDNNPKFKMPFYRKTIPENSMNGVTIANIVAYDIDKNKTISYSLEGSPKISDLLHMDAETGEIVVANRIDHETFQWLNFSVKATDSGYPSRSSLVDVFVSVLDENDNNPYFTSNVKNFSVSENVSVGTRIATIQAIDADSGDFGKITFLMDRISSHGKFSIDADTGVLSVSDTLDRETKDFYMLVIEAWDNYQFGYLAGESRNAFKQIYVNVLDENDSPPVLIIPRDCIQITEYHEIKDIITIVKATDNDDPKLPNGRIEFSITEGNEHGLFQLNQIDYWTAHLYSDGSLKGKYGNYTLIIQARDLGSPPNAVKESLQVCISDFNDHPPVFISPSHNVTVRVPENATVGSLIIQVHATDEDIGANAAVRYKLKPDFLGNYQTFEINESNGMIYLKEPLDRERQKIYEIRVEAYDQGIPTSLSSDLDLTIYVRNVNDYEPQFLVEDITVAFTEHSSPGQEKVKLPDTIDRDEVDELDDPPSVVCYFIIHGNDDEIFHLDSQTHILTVQRELDREIKANYTLFVRATENCTAPPKSVPNHTQASSQGFMRFSSESSSTLSFTRRTNTTRQDAFDRFKYSRNLRSTRDISSASSISLLAQPAKQNEDTEIMTMMQDSTIVRVIVYVNDINDNPPKFISRIFTGGITTSMNFGTKFMEIQAIDPDDGTNANVSYYQIGEIRQTLTEGLENIQKAPFLVEKFSGAIRLNFDPQKGMKGYFDFMVLVNDTDGQTDTAHVFIYLLREDQKVRFVFRQHPSNLRDHIYLFRDTLSNVTDAIVNIDEFKIHENKDGSVDKTKTDLYLHLVNKQDNSIYEVADVLKLIDRHIEKLDELFKDFNVLDTQPAEAQLLVGSFEKGSAFVWLVFSNIFVAILLVVATSMLLSQRSNYRRQLRAAKVNIFAQSGPETIVRVEALGMPNTNKHSTQGSNPIWLSAFENDCFKNDEVASNKSSDSLDENFIEENDRRNGKSAQLFGQQQNDLNRYFKVYHQIDKLTNNSQIWSKKLETTEL